MSAIVLASIAASVAGRRVLQSGDAVLDFSRHLSESSMLYGGYGAYGDYGYVSKILVTYCFYF